MILDATDVSVSYGKGQGRTSPLISVDVAVAQGESVAVLGPSGSGKSTLLRVLAGLQRPDSGRVLLDGVEVRPRSGASRRRPVSLVYQDYRLVPFLSAAENVALALELDGRGRSAAGVAKAMLARVGLAGLADRLPHTMSGGEQQRVAIARAMATGPRVLLADEPTGALDIHASRDIGALLNGLSTEHGVAVVVATHDPEIASLVARRLILADGELRDAA
jgi:putative ABC transport system ATP-binding protein